MPVSFEIQAASRSYGVSIGKDLFCQLRANNKDAFFLCDSRFADEMSHSGLRYLAIEAQEEAKALQAMTGVIQRMKDLEVGRGTHVIALGGGITQDIAAFATAIYMRGLDWTYVPTTLLGMVDSCIGGKSSINVGHYKNLVGTIQPPNAIVIDTDFIETLPPLQRAAGLCEAAKICFVRGPEAFLGYLSENPSISMDADTQERVVYRSLMSKKWFIEVDEFDKKERLLLNFGHTFGHAMEAASGFAISHGIAVGLGILCAIAFAEDLGRSYKGQDSVRVLQSHLLDLIAAVPDLPTAIKTVAPKKAVQYFVGDKKHRKDHYSVIVITEAGAVEQLALPKTSEMLTRFEGAFGSLQRRFA